MNRRDFSIYKNYVCHRCFRQAHECECDNLPWQLIMIDELIQPHIRTLNNKGYYTNYSCQAHKNNIYCDMYIMFSDDYDFPAMPDGFKYNKRRRMIYHTFNKRLTDAQFDAEQEKCAADLLKWCEDLPRRE